MYMNDKIRTINIKRILLSFTDLNLSYTMYFKSFILLSYKQPDIFTY